MPEMRSSYGTAAQSLSEREATMTENSSLKDVINKSSLHHKQDEDVEETTSPNVMHPGQPQQAA